MRTNHKKLLPALISLLMVFVLLVTGCADSKKSSTNKAGSSKTEGGTQNAENEGLKDIFEKDMPEEGELDIVSNIFTDALVYTGYNLNKHNADGLRWTYILARDKAHRGWLSNIGYGGGCSGYETTDQGLPNIKRFEQGGLVCASYVTYVYFNYLPNVLGIDTSMLTKPQDAWNADHWYDAALDWVKKGYSEHIGFEAGINYGKHIKFNPDKEIPIGSIMVFCKTGQKNQEDPRGGHVALYAGYKNGYHWVTHVGNDNGPEFCAVERMNCDPIDPHWPLDIITLPSNIRFGASLQVAVVDENGKPIQNAELTLKRNGKTNSLKTNENGNTIFTKLDYTAAELTLTVPEGYTCDEAVKKVNLTSKNNSLTQIAFTIKKK